MKDYELADALLTTDQATKYLDLAPGTLEVWRATKRYDLPYVKVGRNVRYRWSDINAWLKSREEGTGK